MAPAPGWWVLAGGLRGSWCPHDTPLQGRDVPRQQHRPRLEAAAWTESQGVELISVTVGKPPRCMRNDEGLVPRWGAEERGRGGKGTAAMGSPFPSQLPLDREPQAGHCHCPLLGHWLKPFGHPGDPQAGLEGVFGDWGQRGLVQSPPPPWRGPYRGKDTRPGHQHPQRSVSLLLPRAAGVGGLDVAEQPAPWRTTGTAPCDSCCARDAALGPPSSSSPPAGSIWLTKGYARHPGVTPLPPARELGGSFLVGSEAR